MHLKSEYEAQSAAEKASGRPPRKCVHAALSVCGQPPAYAGLAGMNLVFVKTHHLNLTLLRKHLAGQVCLRKEGACSRRASWRVGIQPTWQRP